MELALESEWGLYFDPIWYDFYRLCVRARLNLFICHAPLRDEGHGTNLYDSRSLASTLAAETGRHERRVGDEEYAIVVFPLGYRDEGRIGIEARVYDTQGRESWAGERTFPDSGR